MRRRVAGVFSKELAVIGCESAKVSKPEIEGDFLHQSGPDVGFLEKPARVMEPLMPDVETGTEPDVIVKEVFQTAFGDLHCLANVGRTEGLTEVGVDELPCVAELLFPKAKQAPSGKQVMSGK